MAAPGVVTVKSFAYRGAPEEWSNRYHFVGSAPDNPADWQSLIDDLVTLELPMYSSQCGLVRVYGYADTDHDATYVHEYPSGSINYGSCALGTNGTWAPGDAAGWVRWKTDRTNTKGRPIYLRKYFHSVPLLNDEVDQDSLNASWTANAAIFMDAVNGVSGDWPGLAGPDGVAPGAAAHSIYVTTRTLKRRGPRPS